MVEAVRIASLYLSIDRYLYSGYKLQRPFFKRTIKFSTCFRNEINLQYLPWQSAI